MLNQQVDKYVETCDFTSLSDQDRANKVHSLTIRDFWQCERHSYQYSLQFGLAFWSLDPLARARAIKINLNRPFQFGGKFFFTALQNAFVCLLSVVVVPNTDTCGNFGLDKLPYFFPKARQINLIEPVAVTQRCIQVTSSQNIFVQWFVGEAHRFSTNLLNFEHV